MAIEVIPALLVRSKRDLQAGLESLQSVAPWVQVDLVGHNYLEGEEAFPLWDHFNFEVDLMVPNPAHDAEAMVQLGASRVVVHAQSGQAHKALELLQSYREGDFKVEVGLALQAHDAPEILENFAGLYDYVQVMGIAHEGSQGQPADAKATELVRALRQAHPDLCIQVDGAVAGRIRELVDAGATRLVIGGAIVGAENPKAVYKALYTEANGAQ